MTERWALGAVLMSWLIGVGSAHATSIVAQGACTVSGNPCTSIDSGSSNVVVRGFTFSLSSAKTVLVNFHGSAYCGNATNATDKVVDFVTQIRTDTLAPDPNGPGGLRFAEVLKDTNNNAQNTSDTFNLASTRAISFSSSGNKTVRFMLKLARLDAGVTCLIYNAAFSVTIP